MSKIVTPPLTSSPLSCLSLNWWLRVTQTESVYWQCASVQVSILAACRSVYRQRAGRYTGSVQVSIPAACRSVYRQRAGQYTGSVQVSKPAACRSVYRQRAGQYTGSVQVSIPAACRSVYRQRASQYTGSVQVSIPAACRSVYQQRASRHSWCLPIYKPVVSQGKIQHLGWMKRSVHLPVLWTHVGVVTWGRGHTACTTTKNSLPRGRASGEKYREVFYPSQICNGPTLHHHLGTAHSTGVMDTPPSPGYSTQYRDSGHSTITWIQHTVQG